MLQAPDFGSGGLHIAGPQVNLIGLFRNYLISVSPLQQESRFDPQRPLDLPGILATALEQFQSLQLEFFCVFPIVNCLLVHDPAPVLPSLLDRVIFRVHFFGARSLVALFPGKLVVGPHSAPLTWSLENALSYSSLPLPSTFKVALTS